VAPQTSDEFPHVLACAQASDWGSDPLVSYSPTLSRDYQSLRKLFPQGVVESCKEDADRLGIHAGRQVKVTSAHGNGVVPIRLRTGLQPGVLLVPYGLRDHLAEVLGQDTVTPVNLQPA
jgi:anaerobic selenocysteine-containing dehydrogenase